MNGALSTEPLTRALIRHDHATEHDRLGGKATALATLGRAGLPVPAWIAITAEAFDRSLGHGQKRENGDCGDVGSRDLREMRMEPDLADELVRRLHEMGAAGRRFAVRSSAVDEDSANHSFAGQLETYLFVRAEDVPDRVADVWRSGFSERVMAYRHERGLEGPPPPPVVLVQVMVEAEVSGVAFSADPVTENIGVAVVSSVYGLGAGLVSGELDADTHHVDARGRIVRRIRAHKTHAYRFDPGAGEGVTAVPVAASLTDAWALGDEEVVEVAALARRAAAFFGKPQDVEWARSNGCLHLLQSRPITTLDSATKVTGTRRVWDDSNISESYDGVTTPLTFSFARYAYEGVYERLCRLFGVSRHRIEENRAALANMIGLVRGRVYYNVLSWHRLLAQSPGYRTNARFFEQMIGLREPIEVEALGRRPRSSRWERFGDILRLGRSAISIAAQFALLQRSVRRFHRRVDAALAEDYDLGGRSATELVDAYRTLVGRLLRRWDAPLINDFFAMIFYGTLQRLCRDWCGDHAGTLQNDLLCSSGGMISAEPATRLRHMAELVHGDDAVIELLRTGDSRRALPEIERHPSLAAAYHEYMVRFGERCTEELKLESQSLEDDPSMLLRAMGAMATLSGEISRGAGPDPRLREEAERRVRGRLRRYSPRRAAFFWVLHHARRTVRNRENLRLERTRVFGRVRRIFVELGRRLFDLGVLDDPRDVFYLHVDEVLGYVEGAAVTTDLRALVALRRREFTDYATEPAPPSRFETHGPVAHDLGAMEPETSRSEDGSDIRRGIGCCPGRVRGRVRVVLDPRRAEIRRGDILVAERTDPGWIMLFPLASGLLVERGNLLSHSAIVAREMGLPAVVAIDGVTRWLADGDTVVFDGATGLVRKVGDGHA